MADREIKSLLRWARVEESGYVAMGLPNIPEKNDEGVAQKLLSVDGAIGSENDSTSDMLAWLIPLLGQ